MGHYQKPKVTAPHFLIAAFASLLANFGNYSQHQILAPAHNLAPLDCLPVALLRKKCFEEIQFFAFFVCCVCVRPPLKIFENVVDSKFGIALLLWKIGLPFP